jgi:putative IMPACT (imprinted ancient) family translation regulator
MATQREPVARLTVERSRFFGLFAPLRSEGEIKALLARRRKTVKRARHHCWASRLVNDDGLVVETAHNDGEVGKPGLRLLELLRRNDLCGVLVVSRVFGGVKLGPAGVGRAFKETGVLAVELYREG